MFSTLQPGEEVFLNDYIGHMLSPGERSDIGMAFRFLKVEDGFKIYKHDPYAEDVRAAIQDSAIIEDKLVYPIDRIINYYRNLPEYGGCTSVTNFKAVWQVGDSTFIEQYHDDTCSYGDKFPIDDNPIMPPLRAAGFKPKL